MHTLTTELLSYISTISATMVSDWPTPTVSTNVTSYPAAIAHISHSNVKTHKGPPFEPLSLPSHSKIASLVLRATCHDN